MCRFNYLRLSLQLRRGVLRGHRRVGHLGRRNDVLHVQRCIVFNQDIGDWAVDRVTNIGVCLLRHGLQPGPRWCADEVTWTGVPDTPARGSAAAGPSVTVMESMFNGASADGQNLRLGDWVRTLPLTQAAGKRPRLLSGTPVHISALSLKAVPLTDGPGRESRTRVCAASPDTLGHWLRDDCNFATVFDGVVGWASPESIWPTPRPLQRDSRHGGFVSAPRLSTRTSAVGHLRRAHILACYWRLGVQVGHRPWDASWLQNWAFRLRWPPPGHRRVGDWGSER